MSDPEKIIAKEIFAPVTEKFDRIKINPQNKDECWSIDLNDRSKLSKYNNKFMYIFTIDNNYRKYA